MTPLIDGDVLRYEVGAIAEGDDGPASFDFAAEVLDGRIRDICEAVNATEPPLIYLTGANNFRDDIAVTKPYKGNRKNEKPYHFANLTVYLFNQYDIRYQEGLEADDLMAIEQTGRTDTCICTRDKDLRMVPGWHYGWECGAQREYKLRMVDDRGEISLDTTKRVPKLVGTGERFFYAQLLMGDSVDNIPGLPGVGPAKAYKILEEGEGDSDWDRVLGAYRAKDKGMDYLMEQAMLLWMVREIDHKGEPVMWSPPQEIQND